MIWLTRGEKYPVAGALLLKIRGVISLQLLIKGSRYFYTVAHF
jgi:hypothetical protein